MSTQATTTTPGTLLRPGLVAAPTTARRTRAAAAVTAASLLTILLVCLVVVLVAANRPSFLVPDSRPGFYPGWLAGPLGGLFPGVSSSTAALRWVFTMGLVVMYLAYLLALRHAASLRARWVIAAIVAVHVVMVFSPPLSLTDIFNYVNYGRMEIVHHLNPYASQPYMEPHNDPSFDLSNWHHLLSPYGPLFTVFTFALVPLGVAASFWTLKVVLMAASLGTIALVWGCARLLRREPRQAIVFVGLNPLVLLWGLGGDHNDFLMMLLIIASFYLLLKARSLRPPETEEAAAQTLVLAPSLTLAGLRARATRRWRRRPPSANGANGANGGGPPALAAAGVLRGWRQRAGRPRELVWPPAPLDIAAGALLATAVAVKASAGILLPVLLVALLVRPRDFVQVLIGVVGAGVVLGVVTYVAFGAHIPDLSTQARLVTSMSIPNLVGLALGQGGETQTIRTAMTGILVVSVLISAWWAARHRGQGADALVTGAGWASVVLILTLSWVLPWYVLWTLPLAILSRSRALRNTVLALGVYLIVAWMPLQADLFRLIHFAPLNTPLGQQHQRDTKALLR